MEILRHVVLLVHGPDYARIGRGSATTLLITGFNTDVKYKGVVYHVQTEDKGVSNPLIETLIYKGGEILGSRAAVG